MKKLYRSTQDHQMSGVLGGLSELYNIDVSLLRISMVVLCFFTGGFALLLYIAAAIIMPTDQEIKKL
ncbi:MULTISPECIES: PspC domain-containing protein [Pontibacillus]|uniref:PspC domain-containing protein n=1 Tax=Pontibacillus chungwhensis TaxID=265426 RepID=A0ABY8UZ64_9BACI|nr:MULTISPECIES: PspC domain-containing protein [Pontibacillus]MCD5325018.1 PspC domain-containing protein [Pontibacillus sp. HN14]WIF98970.1 PspC domain-containing protein [Pontibacillus chungwhensis]